MRRMLWSLRRTFRFKKLLEEYRENKVIYDLNKGRMASFYVTINGRNKREPVAIYHAPPLIQGQRAYTFTYKVTLAQNINKLEFWHNKLLLNTVTALDNPRCEVDQMFEMTMGFAD
jgi:hypothetical protein